MRTKVRNILAVLICVPLMLGIFSACGSELSLKPGAPENETGPDGTAVTDTPTPEPTPEPVAHYVFEDSAVGVKFSIEYPGTWPAPVELKYYPAGDGHEASPSSVLQFGFPYDPGTFSVGAILTAPMTLPETFAHEDFATNGGLTGVRFSLVTDELVAVYYIFAVNGQDPYDLEAVNGPGPYYFAAVNMSGDCYAAYGDGIDEVMKSFAILEIDTPSPEPGGPGPMPDTGECPEDLYAASLEELGDMWARAYCNRDADTLYALCHDKALYRDIGGYEREDGSLCIGMSSPWPWYEDEAKVIVTGDKVDYILYWRTSSSIDIIRSALLYVLTENGYQVAGVDNPYPAITSKAAFEYHYASYFTYMDDLLPTLNESDPIAAALRQLNIEDAEATQQTQPDGSVRLTFTWPDGSVTVIAEQFNIKGVNGIWVVTRVE